MTALLGVLTVAALLAAPPTLDPQHLPALPPQGLAVSTAGGVTLVDLRGRQVGRLDGFRFAPENSFGAGLPRFADAAGRLWRLDRGLRRLVPASAGQPLYGGATLSFVRRTHTWLVRTAAGRILLRMKVRPDRNAVLFDISEGRDVVTTAGRAFDLRTGTTTVLPRRCSVGSARRAHWILLCGSRSYSSPLPRTVEELSRGRRRVIARPPGRRPAPGLTPVGHWAGVRLSPDGRSLLMQWSAECEIPQAYLVSGSGRRLRRLGGASDESIGLGWTSSGLALVYFPSGLCGGTYHLGPGVYAVGAGKPRLIVKAARGLGAAMWGG